MTKATGVKKKRELKNIDFSGENSHIALVGPAVGGPANGQDFALIMKSANYSQEYITKMQEVQVTLPMPEFLQRFFHMYYEDSLVLAMALGYQKPEEEEYPESYEDYIDEKVARIKILKSVKDMNHFDLVSKLSAEDYLELLKAQSEVEPLLLKSVSAAAKAEGKDASIASEVKKKKEVSTSTVKVTEKNPMENMVDKSELEAVQKSLQDLQVELQKARDALAAVEAEKKAQVLKSRKEKVVAAVKDEARAEIVFKAVQLVESDEDFEAVVKALAEMTSQVEKSELFQEKGASAEPQASNKESAVMKAVKKLNPTK